MSEWKKQIYFPSIFQISCTQLFPCLWTTYRFLFICEVFFLFTTNFRSSLERHLRTISCFFFTFPRLNTSYKSEKRRKRMPLARHLYFTFPFLSIIQGTSFPTGAVFIAFQFLWLFYDTIKILSYNVWSNVLDKNMETEAPFRSKLHQLSGANYSFQVCQQNADKHKIRRFQFSSSGLLSAIAVLLIFSLRSTWRSFLLSRWM